MNYFLSEKEIADTTSTSECGTGSMPCDIDVLAVEWGDKEAAPSSQIYRYERVPWEETQHDGGDP